MSLSKASLAKPSVSALLVAAAGLALTGCSGLSSALGLQKNPPDEFAIVTKAPLVVPPDFSLRPPQPGAARPQERRPEDRAQAALFGEGATNRAPSSGERVLVQLAGGFNADPEIRKILNEEGGSQVEKELAFANRLMFWTVNNGEIDYGPAPLPDDEAEEWLAARNASVEQATGGAAVTINRNSKVLNLPGVF